MPNHNCSSGVGVIVLWTMLRPALPRRGWSIVYTPKPRRRKIV